MALQVAKACIAQGIPIFGLCRGIQEMGVAFGSTLHPEIRELPGRMNHRAPRLENGDLHPDPAVVFPQIAMDVRLIPGGVFARLFDRETIRVNSLHGQGILEPGDRVVVEGVAEDGTIEAIRIAEAPGFALGVQWARRARSANQSGKPRPVSSGSEERSGNASGRWKRRGVGDMSEETNHAPSWLLNPALGAALLLAGNAVVVGSAYLSHASGDGE